MFSSHSHSCKINRNQIDVTIFRLIWTQMKVRLVQNQSENCNFNNIILVNSTRVRNGFLCVYELMFYVYN